MRYTPDHEPRKPGGPEARHFRTFITKEEWLNLGYQDSPEFSALSESEIVADMPERDEKIDQKTRAHAEKMKNYTFHSGRLQRPQYRHLFRKMNYLKKRAINTGLEEDLEAAWEIRQQLAAELFWQVENIIDFLQKEFPDANPIRISDFAIEELYRKIDEFNYLGGSNFANFANQRIYARALSSIEHQPGGTIPPETGIKSKKVSKFRSSETEPTLDQEAIKQFWNLICQKLEAIQKGDIKRPSLQKSDKPLADIVYSRYAEGHSLTTISEAMDTSTQNISVQLSRALRYIREIILRDPEVQEFLRKAGFEEIQDNQDVYLLINRVRYRPRTGRDKNRRG